MRARNRPENFLEVKPEPEPGPKSPARFQLCYHYFERLKKLIFIPNSGAGLTAQAFGEDYGRQLIDWRPSALSLVCAGPD